MVLAANVVVAQKEISVEDLPANVQVELTSKYKKYQVNEVWETLKNDQLSGYKVLVQKKNNVLNLKYDLEGTFLYKTKSKSFEFNTTDRPKPRREGDVTPPPMPNM